MAMKPEIKDKWVKALRSGDYAQGKNVLRREDDTYCCLGVLCELAVQSGAIEPAVLAGDRYRYGSPVHRSAAFLTVEVERWAGIVDDGEHDGSVISNLIGYNDDGENFQFIADVIEARL